jgi:hypothetical protein
MLNKLIFLSIFLLSLSYSHNLDSIIKLYETNDGKSYVGDDSLIFKIREKLDVDIYRQNSSIYVEWDEKEYQIKEVNIYKNGCLYKTIKYSASLYGHRWSGFVDKNLKSGLNNYKIKLLLENGKTINQNITIKLDRVQKRDKNRKFIIYDSINGKGLKDEYLKKHTKSRTLKEYGLKNSSMFWVDDFFYPIPTSNDADINRIKTKPQLKRLQKLLLQRVDSDIPYRKLDKNGGLVILDIEHVPTIVSYVEREFSPYGSFVSKFLDDPKVTQNGRKIVSHTIAKKLKCVKAVKEISQNFKVGLWESIVPWNRYNNINRNRDNVALAKGTNINWLINYDQWHKKDSILYKAFTEAVDFLSPALYPAFDLSTNSGKIKQLGYIMSKLTEIKRLNPDAIVIPTICPQYTEGWADNAGYNKKPLKKGVFTWYLNVLYKLYKDGFIDSIIIWGDNEKTTFIDYTKQDWWFELLQFTSTKCNK